jgi:general secretion pathway protein G
MKKNAFTLVEILIVVIILGILAAIVIPQFTQASNDARTNSLLSDLQTVRSQIQLYKVQHLDNFPTSAIINELTLRSNQAGTTAALTADPNTYPLGPYIQKFPMNAYSGNNNVRIGDPAGTGPEGWDYNPATGAFHANDSDHSGV